MNSKILVTGANGTIGSALVRKLKLLNADFIVAVRDTAKAKQGGLEDSQVIAFDFGNVSSYANATEGVDAVFLLGPPATLQVDKLIIPFLEHLKKAGIRRVVYVSAMGSERMGDALSFHSKIEEKLKADGFDFTILKPSFFAQNFKNYEWENITQRGIIYLTAGAGKAAFVDVEDVAAVAAAALTEQGHNNQTYTLTGPESLSYDDAAALLTRVIGKKIVYQNPTPEEYSAALKNAGAPDFIAAYMIAVYSLIARNEADVVTGDIVGILGRQPVSLRTVLEREFA